MLFLAKMDLTFVSLCTDIGMAQMVRTYCSQSAMTDNMNYNMQFYIEI